MRSFLKVWAVVLLWGVLVAGGVGECYAWRSSLYPENWCPGYRDGEGRFLHDFSYAGYRKGEEPVPNVTGPVFNVEEYGARGDDEVDDTEAIQAAIRAAEVAGGGVVYLPAGTYFVTPRWYGCETCYQGGPVWHPWALLIGKDGVVLRGEGPERTHIFYNSTESAGGGVLMISSRIGRVNVNEQSWNVINAFNFNYSDWLRSPPQSVPDNTIMLRENLSEPTTVIPLETTEGLNVGDWIVIRTDDEKNESFNEDHGGKVNGYGIRYYRQIVAVDRERRTITVDIPTRHPLKTSWNTRIYKTHKAIEEVGVENLSFAMKESDDLSTIRTSYVIYFKNALNCWVRNVKSYPPPQNTRGYGYLDGGAPEELKFHIHSYGIEVRDTRNITIENCDFRNPQHHGGGGNGYAYILQGNDTLIKDSVAYNCRHNFSFKGMSASGNVLYRCRAGFTPNYPRIRDGEEVNGMTLQSDFHMWFSHANLIDNMVLDGDSFLAEYRAASSHYIAASENVFWNTQVIAPHIVPNVNGPFTGLVSDQWGWGYVIGARGPSTALLSVYGAANPNDPYRPDFYEPASILDGNGQGETLEPQSLYLDQLERRLGGVPSPTPSPSCAGEGDVNCDGRVDAADVLAVLAAWLTGGSWGNDWREDVSGDGKVNGVDFGWVIRSW